MRRTFGLSFLVFAAFLWSGANAAEPIHPASVAIVDVQHVLQVSKVARSVQTQIETQRSKFQAQISAEEKELREAEEKLTKLREAGPTEAYAEQEQKLRQRFMTVERHVQARRKALDLSFTEAMAKVRKGIVDTVAAIAKERGVNLAIVKQQVIWNDNIIDITDEVLNRLNMAMPQIEVVVQPEEAVEADIPILTKRRTPTKEKH